MNKRKKEQSMNRHEFLLEMFFKDYPNAYCTRKVGKWLLVKQWNGGNETWNVAIWKLEDYERVQGARQGELL